MAARRAVPHPMRDNGQVPNNPFPEIPVTVPQIIRQVGHRTYQRGAAYQRNREVVRYSYDEDNRTLTGLVNGSTLVPYEVTIRFFPRAPALPPSRPDAPARSSAIASTPWRSCSPRWTAPP